MVFAQLPRNVDQDRLDHRQPRELRGKEAVTAVLDIERSVDSTDQLQRNAGFSIFVSTAHLFNLAAIARKPRTIFLRQMNVGELHENGFSFVVPPAVFTAASIATHEDLPFGGLAERLAAGNRLSGAFRLRPRWEVFIVAVVAEHGEHSFLLNVLPQHGTDIAKNRRENSV